MMTVPLHGKKAAGRVALVDDEDYDLVMQHRWFVSERVRKGRLHGPYVIANSWVGGTHSTIKMHSLITGWSMVDHQDHDGLNNQRSNLRPTTPSRNQRNGRARLNSTSRFKGVCWNSGRKKWLAQIRIDGRNRYLGLFSCEEDAARFYDMMAWEAWGEDACLNFPEDVPIPGEASRPGEA
jgi:AP2 domain